MNLRGHIFPGMLAAVLAAGLGGCMAVYAACAYSLTPEYYPLRQLLWLILGLSVFCLSALIPFRFYKRNAFLLSGSGLLLLVIVIFFGRSCNGMHGWLELPGGFAFQPSELSKSLFLLLLIVLSVETAPEWKRFLKMLSAGILFCGLILLEPDMGSALVYFSAILLVLWNAGFSWRYPLILVGNAVIAGALFLFRHPYALRRITAYWDPNADFYGSGWHIKQFQYAMAQGGLFGSESGGAVWANAYLPLSYSDSAFATIIETSGFSGGLLIILGFAGMVIIMRRIALRSGDQTAALYIFSAGAVCAVQALIHISVNVTMFPTTGLTLPFFSYGGSSLLGTMLLFGIACSAAEGE